MAVPAAFASSRVSQTCSQKSSAGQAAPASQPSMMRMRAAQAALSVSIDHLLIRVPGVMVGRCDGHGAEVGKVLTASVIPIVVLLRIFCNWASKRAGPCGG